MSGKPYPDGVKEFRVLLAQMAETSARSNRLRTASIEAEEGAKKADEEFAVARKALFTLMNKMDIESIWPLWVLTGDRRDTLIFRSLRDPAFTMLQTRWYITVKGHIRPWPWFHIWQWWNRMKWQAQTGKRWWTAR